MVAISIGCGVIQTEAPDTMFGMLVLAGGRLGVGHINAEWMFENTARVHWDNDPRTLENVGLIPLEGAIAEITRGMGQVLVIRGDEVGEFIRKLIEHDQMRLQFAISGRTFLFDITQAGAAIRDVTEKCLGK